MEERHDDVRQAVETALATRAEADVSWLGPAQLSSGWALAPGTLSFLARLVDLLEPRHILELGSGASTRVLAAAASRRRPAGRVTSIDHDPEFVARAVAQLEQDGTAAAARVLLAPLVARRHGGVDVPVYRWDRGAFRSRRPADLVLIDGPPRMLGGRQGTLYQVLEVSRSGTLILLDDADRSDEAEALAKWKRDFGQAIDVHLLAGLEKGMAALLVGGLDGVLEKCRADNGRPGSPGRAPRSETPSSEGSGT